MEFKASEIVMMVLAFAAPLVVLVLAFIPGAYATIWNFAMDPATRPYAFYGGAAVVLAVLCFRIYGRMTGKRRR